VPKGEVEEEARMCTLAIGGVESGAVGVGSRRRKRRERLRRSI